MLGDTAVAVHPDDPRHNAQDRQDGAAPAPAARVPDRRRRDPGRPEVRHRRRQGDARRTTPNDFETGQRHKLPMISIFDEAGVVNAEGGAFAGLDRFEARKAVKAKLKELGLERGSKPHVHAVGHCQRCETDRRADAVDAVVRQDRAAREARDRGGGAGEDASSFPRAGRRRTWSGCTTSTTGASRRQLWWGHRIPAWYCGKCSEITVARATPAACSNCGAAAAARRTRTCSTPGSRRGCGRSRRSAGRTRPGAQDLLPDVRAGDRVTTSSSSGWPA